MNPNRRPSLKAIIQSDYPSQALLEGPIVLWAFYLILSWLGRTFFDLLSTLMILVISVFMLAALVWRVIQIKNIFAYGQEVTATICKISFSMDIGRFELIYTFNDQKYQIESRVGRSKRTRAYSVGDTVVVMVDDHQPQKAFIRDLYL